MNINNFAFVCYDNSGDTPKIVKKLTVDCKGAIPDFQVFSRMVESLKKKVLQECPGTTNVVIVRPVVMQMAKDMDRWLDNNTDSRKHIGTCCLVRSRTDTSYVWPVFTLGYDIQEEKNRAMMVESCKEISISRLSRSMEDLYVSDEDVHIFTEKTDQNWTQNFLRLCIQEEPHSRSSREYRYFLAMSKMPAEARM